MPPNDPNPTPQRRSFFMRFRPRFSLRTMMVVITIVCVLIPTWILPSERQRRTIEIIESSGGTWAFPGDTLVTYNGTLKPTKHHWYEHYFRRIDAICLNPATLVKATETDEIDLRHLPHLKRFELGNGVFWNAHHSFKNQSRIDPVLKQLVEHADLKILNTSDAWIGEEGYRAIAAMKNLESLKTSSVVRNDIELTNLLKQTNVVALEITLQLSPSDPSLDANDARDSATLSDKRITTAGVRHLADLTRLESLKLEFKGAGSRDVMTPLAELKHLKRLEFDNYNADDLLLSYACQIKSLELLDVSNSSISDEGLRDIKNLTNLRELNLLDTPITAAGLKELLPLKKLEILRLDHCRKLKSEAVDVLLQMPSLRKLSLNGSLKKPDIQGLRQQSDFEISAKN